MYIGEQLFGELLAVVRKHRRDLRSSSGCCRRVTSLYLSPIPSYATNPAGGKEWWVGHASSAWCSLPFSA
jgi:hypothetical protein